MINSYELQWCERDGSIRCARVDVESQGTAELIGQAIASSLGHDVRILQIVRLCCAKAAAGAEPKKKLPTPATKTSTPPSPTKTVPEKKRILPPERAVTPPSGSPIVCKVCNEPKSRSEFYWGRQHGVLRLSYRRCKTCTAADAKLTDAQRKARKRALRTVDRFDKEDAE